MQIVSLSQPQYNIKYTVLHIKYISITTPIKRHTMTEKYNAPLAMRANGILFHSSYRSIPNI